MISFTNFFLILRQLDFYNILNIYLQQIKGGKWNKEIIQLKRFTTSILKAVGRAMEVSTCRHHVGGMVGDWETLSSTGVHYQRQRCRGISTQRYKGISRSKRLATHSHERVENKTRCLPDHFYYITVSSKGRFTSRYLHIYIRKALRHQEGAG